MSDAEFIQNVILNSDTRTKRFYSGKRYSFSFDPNYRKADYSLILYVGKYTINMNKNGEIHCAMIDGVSIPQDTAVKVLQNLKQSIMGLY